MNKDELLRLLDLQGKEPAKQSNDLAITPADEQSDSDSLSPTALDLDDWGLRRGAELLAESPRMQQTGLDEFAVADFHAAAFEPEPVLLDTCRDQRRREFLEQLLQTPAYHSLHASTRLDPVAASIAATAFAEQFASLKEEEEHDKGKDRPDGGMDPLDREMATLRAVGKAITEAGKEVEECHEAVAALGLGPGLPGSNDPRVIASLFRRVRNSPTLRRICELAGRYRRLAQSKQRRKTTHGIDDVVGVVMDGDVGRLLPHELARLAGDDELADDTLRRLVERQAMCREYHASEPVGKGPICVVVDESGSMTGDRVETAKALALALAWVARQQNRWCALVAYSGSSGERLLALPPGRWDEAALLDWLEDFIGKGSDLDLPLRELPDYFRRLRCPEGVTDIIAVTDAQLRIPADLREQFNAWKKQVQARLISLVIRNRAGELAGISEEVHLVQTLGIGEDAVGRVLSL